MNKISLLKIFIFLIIIPFTVNSSERLIFENMIISKLNDPESGKFRGYILNKYGRKACIQWNAKNSFGGYGQWQYARFTKDQSKWRVESLDEKEEQCKKDILDLDLRETIRNLESTGPFSINMIHKYIENSIKHIKECENYSRECIQLLNEVNLMSTYLKINRFEVSKHLNEHLIDYEKITNIKTYLLGSKN